MKRAPQGEDRRLVVLPLAAATNISRTFWKVWDWPISEERTLSTERKVSLKRYSEVGSFGCGVIATSLAMSLSLEWIVMIAFLGAIFGHYFGAAVWTFGKNLPNK